MPDFQPSFGSQLKQLCRTKRLKQCDLADKSGYSVPYISKLAQNKRKPSSACLEALASALNLTDDEFGRLKSAAQRLGRSSRREQETASIGNAGERDPPAGEETTPTATPAQPRVIYHNLPAAHGQLFGREERFARALQGLDSDRAQIEIVGAGGVGKTVLAIQVGHACLRAPQAPPRDPYQAVVWLSASDQPDKGEWLAELLTIIKDVLRLGQGASPDDARRTLSEMRTLVVFDNFETVRDPSLVSWLNDVPAPSKVLVTTREALFPSAWKVELPGLDPGPAVAMIRDRVVAGGMDHLASSSDAFLRQLAEATGGNPKAINMSLGYLEEKILSWDGLIEALRSAGSDVEGLFERLYGWGWRHLEPADREVFQALSLFTASAGVAAIAAVAGPDMLNPKASLAKLCKMCWIDAPVALTESELRYELHPLARAYATSKMRLSAEFEGPARERWVDYYSTMIGRCAESGHTELATEDANIAGVVEWLATNDRPDELMTMCARLQQYWRERWHVGVSLKYLPLVIDVARGAAQASGKPVDRALAMQLMHSYVYMLVLSGGLDQAEKTLLEVLAMAEAGQDRLSERAASFSLAIVSLLRDESEQADKHFARSLELRHEVADPQEWALDIRTFWEIASHREGLACLQEYYKRALQVDQNTGNRRGEGLDAYALSQIARIQGRLTEAFSYLDSALGVGRESGHRIWEAVALACIGECYMLNGNLRTARSHVENALALFTKEHATRELGSARWLLGMIHAREDDLAGAETSYQTALSLVESVGDIFRQADVRYHQACLAEKEGRFDDAKQLYRTSLRMCQSIRNGPGIATSSFALGRLLIAHKGEHAGGRKLVNESIARFAKMGSPEEAEARAYLRSVESPDPIGERS